MAAISLTYLLPMVMGFLFQFVKGTNLNVVRQDSSRYGSIELYRDGKLIKTSNVEPFPFSWPLVEMTSNTKDKEVYVVTFPDTSSGPVLHLLDQNLKLKNTWQDIPFSFFDLQYSNTQNTLFGIYVSSTYGRVLSHFVPNPNNSSDSSVEQLFTLPYMWYVNASSFHHPTCTYYALINYFPGHPESTLDQQLVVADFTSISNPKANVYLITQSPGIIQFLGFSHAVNQLFYAGMVSNKNTAMVGTLDTATGAVRNILWTVDALAVGPLVVDDTHKTLSVYTKDLSGKKWQLWSLSQGLTTLTSRLVAEYEVNDKLKVFAAASIGF